MENHSQPGAKRRKPLLDPDQPAHPAMLLLVNPDGSPKPEFKDWERDQLLDVDAGTLVPVWWPREHPEDGHILSYEERVGAFSEELTNLLSPRLGHTGSVTPAEPTPAAVLASLHFLRDAYAPADNLAQD